MSDDRIPHTGSISGVSVAVALHQLRDAVARFGLAPYLLTVTDDGRPHAVAVAVEWDGARLTTEAGSRTIANAAARPAVCLLWSPYEAGGYSLIVDGVASIGAGAEGRVTIEPTKGILHRRRAGAPGSDCVTVLAT